MSRWIELRLDKLIDDVIVKGSLRAAINGLVYEMSIPIPGIRYRGNHIPYFTLQYRKYIDDGKLSNYGKSESEELMIKAYSFSKFIQNNKEYAKHIYETYEREHNILDSKFCNVSTYRNEKSKAKQLIRAGLISSRHYQNVILKKLTREHSIYIQKVNELRYEYNTKLADKLGHCSTFACEDLDNLLWYYNNTN